MARIRTIKPEFFSSEQIVECSSNARLTFVGMWCFCDDGGVHPASVKRLKMEVWPGDDVTSEDIAHYVNELIANGLLLEFEAEHEGEKRRFWAVRGWHHQKIDRPNVKYPSPSDGRVIDEPSTSDHRLFADLDRRTLVEHSPPESKGREGKRKGEDSPPIVPPTANGSQANGDYDPEFEVWWQRVPRKVGKGGARKAYRAARRKADVRTLADGIERYAEQVAGKDPQYIAHPATWLNQERWLDEATGPPAGEACEPDTPEYWAAQVSEDSWRMYLKSWQNFEQWPEHLGDPPIGPQCLAPPELLREYGFPVPLQLVETKEKSA